MPFYAVAKGNKTGIFTTWSECQKQIKGYSGSVFKKFKTENEAKEFISFTAFIDQRQAGSGSESGDEASAENDDKIYIYTDGACSNNGGKNAKAGFVYLLVKMMIEMFQNELMVAKQIMLLN